MSGLQYSWPLLNWSALKERLRRIACKGHRIRAYRTVSQSVSLTTSRSTFCYRLIPWTRIRWRIFTSGCRSKFQAENFHQGSVRVTIVFSDGKLYFKFSFLKWRSSLGTLAVWESYYVFRGKMQKPLWKHVVFYISLQAIAYFPIFCEWGNTKSTVIKSRWLNSRLRIFHKNGGQLELWSLHCG